MAWGRWGWPGDGADSFACRCVFEVGTGLTHLPVGVCLRWGWPRDGADSFAWWLFTTSLRCCCVKLGCPQFNLW